MKYIMLCFLFALSVNATERELFSGKIDLIQQEGERIDINGSEYRITGDTLVMVGQGKISIDDLKVGQSIRYELDLNPTGMRKIRYIQLDVSEEEGERLLRH